MTHGKIPPSQRGAEAVYEGVASGSRTRLNKPSCDCTHFIYMLRLCGVARHANKETEP